MIFIKHKKKSKPLKPIIYTLDMAKKMYADGREYRFVVCDNRNIPHTLCRTYEDAGEVCIKNSDTLSIIDLAKIII